MNKGKSRPARPSTASSIRPSDEDADSRPHSPDKQAKAVAAGRSSKGQAEQQGTSKQQSRQLVREPQLLHSPPNLRQQHRRAEAGAARDALVRKSAAAAVCLSKVQTIRVPSKHPATPAPQHSSPSKAPAAAVAGRNTEAAQLPAARPLSCAPAMQRCLQLTADERSSSSYDEHSICTDSSCSSVLSAGDQLLLSAAVGELHTPAKHAVSIAGGHQHSSASELTGWVDAAEAQQELQEQTFAQLQQALQQQEQQVLAADPVVAECSAVAATSTAERTCSCEQQVAAGCAGECTSGSATTAQLPSAVEAPGPCADSACPAPQLDDGNSSSCRDVETAAAAAHAAEVNPTPPVSVETSRTGASAAPVLLGNKSSISEAVLSAGGSLTASEFDAITRDVAARIIQTHWHAYRQRCVQQQQQHDVEQKLQLQQKQQKMAQDLQQQPQQQQQPGEQQPGKGSIQSLGVTTDAAGFTSEQPTLPQHQVITPAQQKAAVAAAAAPAVIPPAPAAPAASSAGAALSKLRAAAGSRNACKLQQLRSAHSAAAPQVETLLQLQPSQQPACAGSAARELQAQHGASEGAAVCFSDSSCQAGATAAAVHGQQQVQQHSAGSGGKLSTILAYLDAVEASAQQDVALLPAGLSSRPGTSCVPRTAATFPANSPGARPQSAQQPSSSSSSSGGRSTLRQPTSPLLQTAGCQQQQQQQQGVLLWDGADWCQDGGAGSVAVSPVFRVGGQQGSPPTHRPAVLAESVFDGVKAKMRNLKAALAEKEDALQALTQEVEALRASQQHQLQQLAATHQQQLAAAAAESSASLARHMGLIDRLMEEKGQLARKLEEAHRAAAASEERHSAAVAALKQGWAVELKRQAANWEAAAAAKQEAWRAAKVAEIKEQTVKGLESEVQRLINRHRSELQAAHDKAAEQVKVALEGAQADHKAHVQALKERWHQQQDECLERERAAAAVRLSQANERWEGQLQALRMRLSAETDAKLEAAAAVVREEKRKGEAALEAAEARFAAREALLNEEAARQKEAMARAQTRALEAAKQAAADERTAWRAAITERLKHQAAEREEKLRAELLKQRDEQLEVVIRRLEAEGAAAREAATAKVAAEHTAALSLLQDQLRQSQEGAKRLAERGKAAAAAAAAAEREKLELQQGLEQTRREMANQQQALAAARAALAAKDADVSAAAATAAAAAAGTMQQLQGDKARLEGRLQEAQEQLAQARQRHEADMQHVELRVKAMVACKDEAIQQLQQQLAAALEALRGTEAVLAAQQEELGQV